MNYRHAYHAGNFADVLKHSVLARVLRYMTAKPQPLRVIDVHAGIARYDLEGLQAGKTGEWKNGIARLLETSMPAPAASLLEPYLSAVRDLNRGDGGADTAPRFYPGSPLIARAFLRPGDTLIANELHPDDARVLKAELAGAAGTKVLALDAWVALRALLPPPERRGLILIDPPYEAPGEFARLALGVSEAIRRFATGTFLIWYPVKDPREVARFILDIRGLGLNKVLNVTLAVNARGAQSGLTETGVLVINPPYVLRQELEVLLPALAQALAQGAGAGFDVQDWSR